MAQGDAQPGPKTRNANGREKRRSNLERLKTDARGATAYEGRSMRDLASRLKTRRPMLRESLVRFNREPKYIRRRYVFADRVTVNCRALANAGLALTFVTGTPRLRCFFPLGAITITRVTATINHLCGVFDVRTATSDRAPQRARENAGNQK